MRFRDVQAKRILVLVTFLVAGFAFAQMTTPLPKVSIGFDNAKSPEDVSASLQIIALMTVLSLAPAITILTTAFTRIVIILSFTRTALGTQSVPPNQVLIGLTMFLTFFVMGPTYRVLNETALQPYLQKRIVASTAWERAQVPVKEFMLRNTYKKDLTFFLKLRKERPQKAEDINLFTLIPAFITSELKTAFVIGFYIFIPFLVIDLIVSSALMSMGMMMMPPTVVSLPAKLLVFTLADGWSMLVNSIVSGYL